ncbi:MAG: UvrD-helicase domain-containing protein [Patescibacteria group bacterium]
MSKETLLHKLKNHIEFIRTKIVDARKAAFDRSSLPMSAIKGLAREDQVTYWALKAQFEKRVEELDHLYNSPYFIKVNLTLKDSGEKVEYRFAKFHLSDEKIYSWVAPVASIRFEEPGPVFYTLPDGTKKHALLEDKEQYMIVDGNVIFFAKESLGTPRELIHQEHFSNRKSGFMLPEIVAQMEKAQDQVIRAHHKGPLVIAGPAGSGKTTLAFHRVAYLVQAPDTSQLYPERSIIILVQDNGTKDYFSHLLPELGIKGVHITTFSEWAFTVLDLDSQEYSYAIRFGSTEQQRDAYEFEKLQILRSKPELAFNAKPFTTLNQIYSEKLSVEALKLFAQQKKEKKLDRFDLTLLLQCLKGKHKDKKLAFRKEKTVAEYSFALVDEFQNYLPEQLSLFKSTLAKETQSIVYVGDMAQQIQLGTIRSWEQIGEAIPDEKQVLLKKVYRNTKNILNYIQKLGYDISIPEQIKSGPDVSELVMQSNAEEIDYIKSLIEKYPEQSIGILAQNPEYLSPFISEFKSNSNVHILTMRESQGVEFDIVCIVGIDDSITTHNQNEELTRIKKDLLYVALTRAITELHVLGKINLSKTIQLK